jgi:hypothetical protein
MAGNITYETVDIELYRNDSYVWTFDVTDVDDVAVDMTGYTFDGQVRRTYDSADALAEFRFIETNVATGELTAILDPAGVTAIDADFPADGDAVYDIQIMSDDATPIVHTVRRGVVTFVDDVTRP